MTATSEVRFGADGTVKVQSYVRLSWSGTRGAST
jgi:hypothetical protein